jgi:hypothetical protein
MNTDMNTVVMFTKKRYMPREGLKLFEQQIPWSASAKYLAYRSKGA